MDWQSEAPLLLKNATEESRQKIEEEMKKSSFLYSVRSSFKTFTIGSIATVIAAHFTQEPISAILTAGIVAGLEVSDRIIKKQQNVNPLVQHYMSIK